jgi:integrase
VTLAEARERALEFRRLAQRGLDPRHHSNRAVPTFEELATKVHLERLPTWKNQKHAAQWISTLRAYAFPTIGPQPVSEIGQPEVLACLSPIWTDKPETARRLAQRIGAVLDVARSSGFRDGENPVAAIRAGKVLPRLSKKPKHHAAMHWRDVPDFYARLSQRNAMAAKALMFTCLTGARTGEVLGARWEEFDMEGHVWTVPAQRMKGGEQHRVPLTREMLQIVEELKPLESEFVFEGQRRNRPLSNMAMLMLLRRMEAEAVTVHGFRSTFRVWAAEVAQVPREVAEMSLSHRVGSDVERAYSRSDLLDRRRELMARWAGFVTSDCL